MRNRLPAFILMILLLLPCYGRAFISNAIGQELEPLDALSGQGYEGESDGSSTIIYHDGIPIMKCAVDSNGYTIERGGEKESVLFDESGRPLEWRYLTESGEEIHRYSYDGSRLSSVNVSIDGAIVRITEYLVTPSGRLAALSGSEDAYIGEDFYVYSLDGESVRVSFRGEEGEGLADVMDYEVEPDGGWTRRETLPDGSERIVRYDAKGRLVEEYESGKGVSYFYGDDGALERVITERGGEEVIESYDDGQPVRSEYRYDGITERVRYRLDDGSIEEIRYRHGQPDYRILFDGDGLRVKEVERL